MLKRVFVIAALLSASVNAAILVSNLNEPTRATTIIDEDLWALQSFVTDNNSYTLINIMTVLGDLSVGPSIVSGPVVAELRDFTTGSLLTTFSVPSLAGPPSVKTLTPNTPVTLDPNTIYFLMLGANGADSFGWSYAEGENFVGPGTLFVYGYSSDQGANFGAFDTENPYKVQVNVDPTAVPEPSTLALSVVALLVLAALRRSGWRDSFTN